MADSPDMTVTLIRVARASRVASVAGAIAGLVRNGRVLSIQAVGSDAINRAVRAVALATQYLRDDGISLFMDTDFLRMDTDDPARHIEGIRFTVHYYNIAKKGAKSNGRPNASATG